MGRQRKFTPWLAGITALVALAILPKKAPAEF